MFDTNSFKILAEEFVVFLDSKLLTKIERNCGTAMKMLTTTRQKSLSLSGGHIVSDDSLLLMPSYSPNAVTATSTGGQHFPWEEDVNEINTPDIDPSFFDSDPFKLKIKSVDHLEPIPVAELNDETYFGTNTASMVTLSDDSSSHTQSYEDMNLSQMLSQTNVDINVLINAESESMMTTNEMLDTTYTPVLHYLEPKNIAVDAIALNVITTNPQIMDTTTSICFTSPTHSSSQSYSPALSTINYTHLSPSPSPSLSYTSTMTSSPSTLMSMDSMPSESSTTATTLEGLIVDTIDQKPDLEFLQPTVPTVVTDHLYTLPTASGSGKRRRKSSAADKESSLRKKNSVNSKKSRVTKKDKQKQMDEQIQYYLEDNETCRKRIEQMEREIEWCKNYLFKKVVASARS